MSNKYKELINKLEELNYELTSTVNNKTYLSKQDAGGNTIDIIVNVRGEIIAHSLSLNSIYDKEDYNIVKNILDYFAIEMDVLSKYYNKLFYKKFFGDTHK